MAPKTVYDLALFKQLNEEYADRPLVPRPRKFVPKELFEAARKRAKIVDKHLDIRGKRVLEIGCGRGHLGVVLARDYGCEVVGVDLVEYKNWKEECADPNVDLRVHDISSDPNDSLGTFDCAVSMVVWEHMHHPYAALEGLKELLKPQGRAYISANLHRGPQASHRYREVFFPWPHLLFEDDVFTEFYAERGRSNVTPAWVNRLTVAHYYQYLRQLDFEICKEWFSVTPIDEELYARFEDKLGRYPRFDLEHDFIHVVVSPRKATKASGKASETPDSQQGERWASARDVASTLRKKTRRLGRRVRKRVREFRK